MIWIAPSEKDTDNAALEKRLWDAADQFRANSGLKSQEYSAPVLGLIFLRFAEVRFAAKRAQLESPSPVVSRHPLPSDGRGAGGEGAPRVSRRGSRVDEPAAYHAEGILYLPAEARFDYLLNRPEAENIGAKVNAAMRDIEKHNPQLAGVLPKTYNLFTSTLLKELLKVVSTISFPCRPGAPTRRHPRNENTPGEGTGPTSSEIPASMDYDAFGRIYEYFLAPWERVAAPAFSGPVQGSPTGRGEFAMSEGQGGGEFYTPSSIVRLLTEVIEPYHGRILDPACGSGGMFVSSARFVSEHKRNPSAAAPTPSSPALLPKGEGGSHYRGGYDFSGLKKRARELRQKQTPAEELLWELLRDRQCCELKFRRQHQFGDYLLDFYCHETKLAVELDGEPHNTAARQKKDAARNAYLKSQGVTSLRFENRVVFEDAEQIFNAIAAHVSPPSPLGRRAGDEGGAHDRANTVLFIDARHVYRQVDRAHREWTPAQIGFLANLVRLYRSEALDYTLGGDEARAKLEEIFSLPSPLGRRAGDEGSPLTYRDVPGLCKAAKLEEIAANGWSLNPGRYVGVAAGEAVSDEDFKEQLETLNEELETLNAAARELEATIANNVTEILEA